MGKGLIKYFRTKEKKTVFPVTRVEAVLARGTTLDKVLAGHDEQISQLRADVKAIQRVDEEDIRDIVVTHWGPTPNGGTSPGPSEGGGNG